MADHGPSGSAGVLALLTVGLEAPSTLRKRISCSGASPHQVCRLLPSDRAAELKSGSPPSVRRLNIPQKNTAPRIRWIRRAAVPPRTIRKNLRRHIASGLRLFQI